ncbi:MAG: beta strand repeat-containing protein, partial [Roseimicrobium sp.]
GKVTTAIGSSHDHGQGVALQKDGRIVVAGYSTNGSGNQDFAIARYQGFLRPTTTQTVAVNTTNFIVAPTAGQAEIYNAVVNITASGYSSIGEAGVGVLNQSGGAHATPTFVLGNQSGSSGTYNQSAGAVAVGSGGISFIGNNGTGTYYQTGGTHTAWRMFIGSGIGASGTYRQRGGELQVNGELKLGTEGSGLLEHSSGTVAASPLTIADQPTARGSYMLTGGTLTTSNSIVGHSGSGVFTQTGGTHTITGTLYLGDIVTGVGTYNAEGGSVSGSTLSVGTIGTGTLNINGGTLTFTNIVTGTGTKTFVFNKGTVNVSSMNISTQGAGLTVGDGTNAAVLNIGAGNQNITSGVRVKTASTLSLAGSNLGGLPVALEGGTITGNGTVGLFTAASGSIIDLGSTTASTLSTTDNVTLASGVNFKVDLTNAGSDQINVSGTVNLAGATLSTTLRFAPSIGQQFTIVQNDGTDAVSGTFNGMPEGAVVNLPNVGVDGGTFKAQLSYVGAFNGNDVVLKVVDIPTVAPGTASPITATGATLSGTVNPNGAATTAKFQYGTTISYGSEAIVTLSPANGTSTQNVSANISGLTPGTLYHYRLTATNGAGTMSTSDGTFTTLSNNANLAGLTLSSGAPSPAFDSAITSYAVSVPNAVSSFTVTPTVQQPNATVKVDNVTVVPGNASPAVNLRSGANVITTVVTAQDGVTTKTYTLTVTRAADPSDLMAPGAPVVTVPAASANVNVLSGATTPITGTASDNKGVYCVEVKHNGVLINATLTAPGATSTGFT